MTSKHAGIALGALGFGLCKTAISVAYITAMGSVSSTVGFVSELDFMFAMNAISFATRLRSSRSCAQDGFVRVRYRKFRL